MEAKRLSRQAAALAMAILMMTALAPARARTADVPELGLVMDLPHTLDVFTRAMDPGDPLPGLYGTTAEGVRNSLASRGLWMEAKDIAGKFAVTLEARNDGGPDYADMSEAELLSAYPGAEVFHTGRAAFALYEQGGQLVAVTRAGGRLFLLRLTPRDRLTGGMRDALREVAMGMDFGLGQ